MMEAEAEAEALPPPPATTPVLLFLHGAGQTALSFALMAAEIMRLATGGSSASTTTNGSSTTNPPPLILCPDLPFHGRTRSQPDDADFSAGRLVGDVLGCLAACLASSAGDGTDGPCPRYSLTLVGHSLGGALAVRLAAEPGLAALGEVKGGEESCKADF